jgi:hypothetical protein
MEWNMHTGTEIQPSVGSLTTDIQGQIRRLAAKMQRWITSLVRKAKKAMVFDRSAHWIHDTIPPTAVLAGAAAFGFWWDSVSAALFACFALFFLAGIYKGLRQLVATLRWEHDRIIAANSNWNTSGTVERSERNFEVGAKAIEHLRPWVEDETALTEESAKAYCSVLLDTLATLHPKFTE